MWLLRSDAKYIPWGPVDHATIAAAIHCHGLGSPQELFERPAIADPFPFSVDVLKLEGQLGLRPSHHPYVEPTELAAKRPNLQLAILNRSDFNVTVRGYPQGFDSLKGPIVQRKSTSVIACLTAPPQYAPSRGDRSLCENRGSKPGNQTEKPQCRKSKRGQPAGKLSRLDR